MFKTGQYARATVDRDVPVTGPEKKARIDLGLEILCYLAEPRHKYTYEEIAAFCGCSNAAIYLIERKALRKLRKAIHEQGVSEELRLAVMALTKPETGVQCPAFSGQTPRREVAT